MTAQPLVSIVIPVYKVERFLPACVDSVLAQTYRNLQILLVDDGSPDGCPALCDAYAAKDPRIQVIHQPNGGLSRARNAGLAVAEGEYVYFLDSDDFLIPEAIKTLVSAAQESRSDIVFFEAKLVSEDGGTCAEENAHRRKHCYTEPMRGSEMLSALIRNGEFMTPVPYLFLSRAFMAGRQFEPDLIYEDVLFTFLTFLDAERAVGLNEPLYRYRIRGGSIMTGGATRRHLESLHKVYRLIEARLTDADASAKATIISELSTLYRAEMYLFYQHLTPASRRESRNAHRSFLQEVADRDYVKASPALFSVSVLRVRVTAWIHRILSASMRKKLRTLLRR